MVAQHFEGAHSPSTKSFQAKSIIVTLHAGIKKAKPFLHNNLFDINLAIDSCLFNTCITVYIQNITKQSWSYTMTTHEREAQKYM